ncbi:hypothetical protein NQ315_008165 [Exocentrus adspersus]|uniref:Cadherin domain-containing protein n=1 Tax=Exocentrus adspersus TaxID=1586481 RepID=A0AAV8VW37_9CUCU|nr:hypothetical protein NQ315_008165 [Exocentrus adspersus]
MKSFLLLLCWLLFISKSIVLTQNTGGCSIEGISDNQFNSVYLLTIADDQINTNLFAGEYSGGLEVAGCAETENSLYFDVNKNDTHLNINSTAEFKDFDLNTPKQQIPIAVVNLNCTLRCDQGESILRIQVQVRDTNNHAPEFSSKEYEFKVPIPVMPLTDFTIYGTPIVATDIDFSNQDITYSLDPEDFTITTVTTDSSKDYTAVFSARSIIQLTGTKTYTLTATDSGTPSQSTDTIITVTVDEDESLDSPTFKAISYSFNYTVDNNVPLLTPNDGAITVVTIKPSSVSKPVLTGEYKDYFEATYDANSSTIDLEITGLLPTTAESFTVLTVSVSTDNTASTPVIVYLSDESTAAPEFTSHYYLGTYDDVKKRKYADHFDVSYDEKTTSCQITVKEGLTAAELKDHYYTTIVIKAAVGEKFDTTALVLSLPEHTLQFTEILYNASYNTNNNTITVDGKHPISFTNEAAGVTITPDSTYSKYFKIDRNAETNQYELAVELPLPHDILNDQQEILWTLRASDDYGNVAETVVVIHLPETITADSPNFSQTAYVADYTPSSKTPVITVETEISIGNRDDQSSVQITLDSPYKDNFDVTFKEDKWVVSVKKAITEEVLESQKELVATLTASEKDNDSTGQAVLIIKWKEAPKFSAEYYRGSYPENGKGSIELDKAISFANVDKQENVVVSLESYSGNFEIKLDAGKWTVTVKKALEDSVVTKNTELVIVLSAAEGDNINKGHSILVLDLTTIEAGAPKFEQAYYVAQYPKDGNGQIEFETPIKFVNVEDQSAVKIKVDQYDANFEIKYSSDKWNVDIKKEA